jgi:hypothetical protein
MRPIVFSANLLRQFLRKNRIATLMKPLSVTSCISMKTMTKAPNRFFPSGTMD